LSTPCHLTFPHFDRPFYVYIDASDVAVGATLNQKDNHGNLLHVKKAVRYWDSLPNPRQITSCSCIIALKIKKWRHYLLSSQPTHISTDNTTVKYCLKIKDPSPRQLRWLEKIQDYPISHPICHIQGIKNKAADALSRTKCLDTCVISKVSKHGLSWHVFKVCVKMRAS